RGVYPSELRDAVFPGASYQAGGGQRDQTDEPPSSPEGREDSDLQTRPIHIPDAVAVRGDHREGVASGRQVGIVGSAARSGFDPITIQPMQFVSEAHLLGFYKTQAGVVDL